MVITLRDVEGYAAEEVCEPAGTISPAPATLS
jgi:hypothetical protein